VSQGWKLARLPLPDVDHHGHSGNAYRLLWRRLTSRACFANGEVLGATPVWDRLPAILRRQRHDLILLAVIYAWWLRLVAAPLLLKGWAAAFAMAMLAAFPVAAVAMRFRSLALGLYSVGAWQVFRHRVLARFPAAPHSPDRVDRKHSRAGSDGRTATPPDGRRALIWHTDCDAPRARDDAVAICPVPGRIAIDCALMVKDPDCIRRTAR